MPYLNSGSLWQLSVLCSDPQVQANLKPCSSYFTQNLKSVRIVDFWLWDIQVIQWADDNYDDDDDNDDNNHYQDHKHQLEDPPLAIKKSITKMKRKKKTLICTPKDVELSSICGI